MLMGFGAAQAQNTTEYFEVGPFIVQYKGPGDYNYRRKEGVDLYEEFGLQKDTIIQVVSPEPEPLCHGVELSLYGETVKANTARFSMAYGLEAAWKQRVAPMTYFNGGLAVGYASATITDRKYNLVEAGVPLTMEFGNLRRQRATLYGGVGVTPTFYATTSAKFSPEQPGKEPEKYNGFYVAPRVELGAYVPVGRQMMKVGVMWRYKVNCTKKDYDVYEQIVGRTFLGAQLGIVF